MWHIAIGQSWISFDKLTLKILQKTSIDFYNEIQVTPLIKKWCSNLFGNDISSIILDYYKNIQIEQVFKRPHTLSQSSNFSLKSV